MVKVKGFTDAIKAPNQLTKLIKYEILGWA